MAGRRRVENVPYLPMYLAAKISMLGASAAAAAAVSVVVVESDCHYISVVPLSLSVPLHCRSFVGFCCLSLL